MNTNVSKFSRHIWDPITLNINTLYLVPNAQSLTKIKLNEVDPDNYMINKYIMQMLSVLKYLSIRPQSIQGRKDCCITHTEVLRVYKYNIIFNIYNVNILTKKYLCF